MAVQICLQGFTLIVLAVLALIALNGKKFNSHWALLWAVLFGLIAASTSWGRTVIDWVTSIAERIAS